MPQLTLATWNTEWRKKSSRDGDILRQRLAKQNPDIVILTETHADFLDDWQGYAVCGQAEYQEAALASRRSILLWSRWPWRDIDLIGSSKILSGCFTKATCMTPLGDLPVIGLIIPYHMSNVSYGTGDRQVWQDHAECLDALEPIIDGIPANAFVAGDFNQRIPFAWGSRQLNQRLIEVFSPMNILTTDTIEPIGELAIDHIACGDDWIAMSTQSISNLRDGGGKVSDHFGLVARVLSRVS